jgi:hypothetical protein
VERGNVVFQGCFPTTSSQTTNFTLLAPPKGQLKMAAGSVSFPPAVQLNEFVIYVGTVTFPSMVKLNELMLYGGSVTFSKESHIKCATMYRGYANFLARAELSQMLISRMRHLHC